jgi:hypothetical protein
VRAKPFRTRQKIRLGSLRDVRVELCRVYKAGCNGEILWQEATRAAHVLSIIARLDEGAGFDQRLAEAEERIATLPPPGRTTVNGAAVGTTHP